MLRFTFRLLGLAFLACAFSALVIDVSRSLRDHRLDVTSFERASASILPNLVGWSNDLIERTGSSSTLNAALTTVLDLPAYVPLGLVAIVLFWLGQPPKPKFGIVSR